MFRYRLKTGNYIIELQFNNPQLIGFFSKYFLQKSSKNKPDIVIKMRLMSRDTDFTMIPDSLYHAKKCTLDGFDIEGGILNCKFNKRRNHFLLNIHPALLETDAIRVFEQVLYQAYVTAAGAEYKNAPLIHSSGVIKNNKGYIFVGESEAGKSTIAELSSKYHVVNDEITIADISGPTPLLVSTPFNGLFKNKQAGQAPLAGIFILKKSLFHSVKLAPGTESVKIIASQIIPPIELQNCLSPEDFLKQIDISRQLSSKIPVYELYFAKDSGFWNEI